MDQSYLINKRLRRAFLGYDVEEVDAFIDEIIRDMDRREQELGVARLRIRILLEELESHGLIRNKAEGSASTDHVAEQQAAAQDASEERNSQSPQTETITEDQTTKTDE